MNAKHAFALAAGAAALSLASAHAATEGGEEPTSFRMEKCYGIVVAGKNDCANAQGTHSCAGYAKTDGDGGEWILLPKGTCSRIQHGSLEPEL